VNSDRHDPDAEFVAHSWQLALAGALLRDGLVRSTPGGALELTVAGRELYRFGGLRHPSRQPRTTPPAALAGCCLAAAADGAGDGVTDLLAAIEAVPQPVAPPSRLAVALWMALVRALRLLSVDDFDAPHPRTVAGLPVLQLLDAVDAAARAQAHPGRLDEWAQQEGLDQWCMPEAEWRERRAACEPENATLAEVAAALDGQRIEAVRLTRDEAPFPGFDGLRLTLSDGTLVNLQNATGGGQLELFATPDAGRYSLRHVDDLDALRAALPGRVVRDATVDDDEQPESLTVTLSEGDAVEIQTPGCEPFITPSPVRASFPSEHRAAER
jgi:hypothetical protein